MIRHALTLIASFAISFTIFLLIPMIARANGADMVEAITVAQFLAGMSWGGWVFMGLALLGVGSFVATVVVAATPSPEDDKKLAEIKAHKIWGFLLRFVEAFTLMKIKPKK